MAFAEVSDLEARWRELSETEQAQASVLLEDASAILSSLVVIEDKETEYLELCRIVVCNMVQRAMASSANDLFGVTQSSMTAGPYTQSASYSNPTGDMYLTKTEKRMLGITNGYIGSIRPMIGWWDHAPWRKR